MSADAPPLALSSADRLVQIVADLHRAVGLRARAQATASGPLAALLALVWSRLGLIGECLARAMARLETPPAPRPSTPAIPPASPPPAAPRIRRRAAPRLPQKFGWLVDLLGGEAAAYGAGLATTLEDAEVRAMLRAAPQLRRLLGPLCRGLGVPVSALLRDPRALRPPAVGAIPPASAPQPVPPPPPAPQPNEPRYIDPTDPRFIDRINEAVRRRRARERWRVVTLLRPTL